MTGLRKKESTNIFLPASPLYHLDTNPLPLQKKYD